MDIAWRQKGDRLDLETGGQTRSGGRNNGTITNDQRVAVHSFSTGFAEENGSKLSGQVKGKLN